MGRSVCVSSLIIFSLSFTTFAGSIEAIDTLVWERYLDQKNGTLFTVLEADGVARVSPSEKSPRAIESSPIYGALYLDTLLLRKESERARQIYGGLIKLARVSGIPGFLVRGVFPDGRRYYGDPSVMDYAALHYGLWRYFNSSQATAAEKSEIQSVVAANLKRLEDHRFIICNEADDPTSYHELAHPGPFQAEHLLMMLLTGYHITGDAHWLEIYNTRIKTRLERLRNYEKGVPQTSWAMHRALLSLTTLTKLEKGLDRRAAFLQGTRSAVGVAAKQLSAFRDYLRWKTDRVDAEKLSQEPVAAPVMIPLFSAHEVIRYWHNSGPLPEFETAPMHRNVWYSAESLAALMLAGDTIQTNDVEALAIELIDKVDFSVFRDVRPLVATLSAYWRGRERGLFRVGK
jgi:hypothetical protein